MEQQQSFSPGLLYSVAPENLSHLHLQDDTSVDGFEWEKYDSTLGLIARSVLTLFHEHAERID
jgi:hypothetical protein